MGHVDGKISKSDVRGAFRTFTSAVTLVGFDPTGWALSEGNSAESWRLCRVDSDGARHFSDLPFPTHIGNTAREAYNRLQAWSQFVVAMRANPAAHLRVQRYPGSKWRWAVAGDGGGYYAELRRIPPDGTTDHSTYSQTNYVGGKKATTVMVGYLNESLSMGGMLGAKPEWLTEA